MKIHDQLKENNRGTQTNENKFINQIKSNGWMKSLYKCLPLEILKPNNNTIN